jgi:Flp pilus assembly protein TadG
MLGRELSRGRSRTRSRPDDGAAAVEFALILPILLTLVFGIITFGFVFAQDLALSNAARQTARYSVVKDRTCQMVIDEAKSAAAPLVTLQSSDVVVRRGTTSGDAATKPNPCSPTSKKPCEGSGVGDNIYVTLDYNAKLLFPVIPGMSSTMKLNGKGVFRCEWSAATP